MTYKTHELQPRRRAWWMVAITLQSWPWSLVAGAAPLLAQEDEETHTWLAPVARASSRRPTTPPPPCGPSSSHWEGRTWKDEDRTQRPTPARGQPRPAHAPFRGAGAAGQEPQAASTGSPCATTRRSTSRPARATPSTSRSSSPSSGPPAAGASARRSTSRPRAQSSAATKWRYGFASAWLERVGDKVMTGILVQQVWGKTDPNDPDRQVAQPIIHPAGLQLLAQERLLPQHRRDRLQLQLGRQCLADSSRSSLRQGLYQRRTGRSGTSMAKSERPCITGATGREASWTTPSGSIFRTRFRCRASFEN